MSRPFLPGLMLCACLVLVTGCIGFFFSPGRSCRDTDLFEQPPVILQRGEAYFLRWKQGRYPFYFYPECKVRDGCLWFAMQATTSTGNAAGREFKIPIEGTQRIEAIKHGGAVWWEPDRTTVRLAIVEETKLN